MNHSTPGFPVHHQLLQFTQTHVHQVSMPSSHLILCPLLLLPLVPPSMSLFQQVNSLHEVAKVLVPYSHLNSKISLNQLPSSQVSPIIHCSSILFVYLSLKEKFYNYFDFILFSAQCLR